MIAMALSCNPSLLIADEPTTALDVTIQAQIIDLLLSLQEQLGMAILMITHDLGVIAETCRRVIVMYAGKVMEVATTQDLFDDPRHPYTMGLRESIPQPRDARRAPQGDSRQGAGPARPARAGAASRTAASTPSIAATTRTSRFAK